MPRSCSGFLRGAHTGQGAEIETLYLIPLALVSVIVTFFLVVL